MSMIRMVYQHPGFDPEPNFPASDQHPDAERFYVWKDGSITKAVRETPEEVQTIGIIEARSKDLSETAGNAMRRAEALKNGCERGTLVIADLEVQITAKRGELPKGFDADVETQKLLEIQGGELAAAEDLKAAAVKERDDLERMADTALMEANKIVTEHGLAAAFDMPPEQRRFLGRLRIPVVRRAFIDCSRKARREIMDEREQPIMVVDAIGEPTMAEIQARLDGDKSAA